MKTGLPLLPLAGLALALSAAPASAAILPASCSAPSLVTALNQAAQHAGPDTVRLTPGCRYTLTTPDNHWYGPNGLPPISDDVTIDGRGATIARAPSARRSGSCSSAPTPRRRRRWTTCPPAPGGSRCATSR